jgi:hypothetical protein
VLARFTGAPLFVLSCFGICWPDGTHTLTKVVLKNGVDNASPARAGRGRLR